MKQFIRFGGIVSAICIVTIAHGQAPSAAEAGWAKMTQCAAIGDDKARHACTDGALREAGLLTEETKAAAKRKTFGLQKPEPLAAAAAPVAAPAPAAIPAPAAAPESATASPAPRQKKQSEHLEVTLAKVEHSGDGKLVLTTSDGAVWHQVESGAVQQLPRQGETMKIESGAFGGFMCQPSKYVWFRCYRSK